jgi:hypothetical protein
VDNIWQSCQHNTHKWISAVKYQNVMFCWSSCIKYRVLQVEMLRNYSVMFRSYINVGNSQVCLMTSYHIHCTANVCWHKSALLLGAVWNQYNQSVPVQHMPSEHCAVDSQCSIVQTLLFTHFDTTVWNCDDCCWWIVAGKSASPLHRMLSVQWNPVFHQDRLSALCLSSSSETVLQSFNVFYALWSY